MNWLCICLISAGIAFVPSASARADVTVLVRGEQAPFASQDWPGQGLAVQLLHAALEAGPLPVKASLTWENDGDKFLSRAEAGEADLALLVPGVDCASPKPSTACTQFHYSDPLLHVVTLLFVPTEMQFDYSAPADLSGKSLCRTVGDGPPPLDALAKSGKVLVVEHAQVAGCFDMLEAGKVDVVAVDEFTGVASLFAQALTESVTPLSQPLATVSLHAIASKTHWRATAHIYRVNAGLAELHQSGAYAELLNQHLSVYWAELRARLR
ncbi:MAG: transporter substrate-binding domain-containing protein [Pseudomonadota bacterium]